MTQTREAAGETKRLSQPLVAFVVRFFGALDEAGCRWLVLRNYEGLPDRVGHDIDLFVSPPDAKRAIAALERVAAMHGLRIVLATARFGFVSVRLWDPEWSDTPFLQIDLYGPVHDKGLEWMPAESILAERIRTKMFWIPRLGHSAANMLLKDLFLAGDLRPKYRARLPALIGSDEAGVRAILEPLLGVRLADRLIGDVRGMHWERVRSDAGRYFHEMCRRHVAQQPLASARGFLRFCSGHFREWLRPSGVFVVLLGPDGSGKTTTSEALRLCALAGLFPQTRYYHANFGTLPLMRDLAKPWRWSQSSRAEVSDSAVHDEPRAILHPLRGAVHTLYYGVSAALSHAMVRRARKYGYLVLADRYYFDYFVQGAYRRVPKSLPRAFLPLIPHPDLVVLLANDPAVIRSRKPEIPEQEIGRQIEEYRKLLQRLPNGVVVSTEAPPTEVARSILERLFEITTPRAARFLATVG